MFKSSYKIHIFILIITFFCTSINFSQVFAGEMVATVLPAPGSVIKLSPHFKPAFLQGMVIHPDNALKFDFLVNKGNSNLDLSEKNQEYHKLIKYFLASLTVPDQDQWVNLSPYEKNRIIQDDFGKTEMGRDLLAQDYLLKQITSSLMYPEGETGREFWRKIYEQIPAGKDQTINMNTFNKVWIIPQHAEVHENGNTAVIVNSRLKVMLEEDYLAVAKNRSQPGDMSRRDVLPSPMRSELGLKAKATEGNNGTRDISFQVIKDIILPALEKEVNEGKNFAQLRQVFSAMILATWYKKALKESLLGKIYADKAKTQGVGFDRGVIASVAKQSLKIATQPSATRDDTELIYQQYLQAFKKGVFNLIKDEVDPATHQMIPRKYFAGGIQKGNTTITKVSPAMITQDLAAAGGTASIDDATADLMSKKQKSPDAAMAKGDGDQRIQIGTQERGGSYRINWVIATIEQMLKSPKEDLEYVVGGVKVKEVIYHVFDAPAVDQSKKGARFEDGSKKEDKRYIPVALIEGLKSDILASKNWGIKFRIFKDNGERKVQLRVSKENVDKFSQYLQFALSTLKQLHSTAMATPDVRFLNHPASFRNMVQNMLDAKPQYKAALKFFDIEEKVAFYTEVAALLYASGKLGEDKESAAKKMVTLVLAVDALRSIDNWHKKLGIIESAAILFSSPRYLTMQAAIQRAILLSNELNKTLEDSPGAFRQVLEHRPFNVKQHVSFMILPAILEITGRLYKQSPGLTLVQQAIGWYFYADRFLKSKDSTARNLEIKMNLEDTLDLTKFLFFHAPGDARADLMLTLRNFETKVIAYRSRVEPAIETDDSVIEIYVAHESIKRVYGDENPYISRVGAVLLSRYYPVDSAMATPDRAMARLNDPVALSDLGGIDLNSANMDLMIKRDGKGVPLPLAKQDLAQLSLIQGFEPRIIEIKPINALPEFSNLP